MTVKSLGFGLSFLYGGRWRRLELFHTRNRRQQTFRSAAPPASAAIVDTGAPARARHAAATATAILIQRAQDAAFVMKCAVVPHGAAAVTLDLHKVAACLLNRARPRGFLAFGTNRDKVVCRVFWLLLMLLLFFG
jgi:hypothetical protein